MDCDDSIYKDLTAEGPLEQVLKELLSHDLLPIIYSSELEGQGMNEAGQFLIGPWAGPAANVENILHEICHFAEREVDKLLERPASGWGFSFGKYWEVPGILGAWGYEPSTDRQVRRESRVWAYQLSNHRHFGMNDDPVKLVGSAPYIPAWCYYQPFAERTHQDEPRIRKLAKEVELMSRNEYTLEAFQDAWNVRIEALSESAKKGKS